MDTSSATLSSYNFVVVFRELRLNELLLTYARKLLPTLPNPLVTEVPNQLIAVVYPDLSLQCQFANRRVDVRQTGRGPVGEPPFCEIGVAAVEKAKESGSQQIVAYGFNFDVLIPLKVHDTAGQYVATYLADKESVGAIFGGSIKDAGVKVSISAECEVNFDLEGLPDAPNVLKAHVNYHYPDKSPPTDPAELCRLMQQKQEEFFRALNALRE